MGIGCDSDVERDRLRQGTGREMARVKSINGKRVHDGFGRKNCYLMVVHCTGRFWADVQINVADCDRYRLEA